MLLLALLFYSQVFPHSKTKANNDSNTFKALKLFIQAQRQAFQIPSSRREQARRGQVCTFPISSEMPTQCICFIFSDVLTKCTSPTVMLLPNAHSLFPVTLLRNAQASFPVTLLPTAHPLFTVMPLANARALFTVKLHAQGLPKLGHSSLPPLICLQ